MAEKKRPPKDGLPICVAMVPCDQVIMGADGTATVVRIVDTIGVPPERATKGGAIQIGGVYLFMLVKNGDATKDYEVNVGIVDPSGKRSTIGKTEKITPNTPESGRNIVMPIVVVWAGDGLYWYEASVGKSRIARAPVRFVMASPEEFASKLQEIAQQPKLR